MDKVFIPAGYMAKRISPRPDWLDAPHVEDILSVSGCVSLYFTDYIGFWKHNGFWLFDSPQIIQHVATEHLIDLSGVRYFYYEIHNMEFHVEQGAWQLFAPEPAFPTNVEPPAAITLEGFDVVSFQGGSAPECSPLSCNGLAAEIPTNAHCLLKSFDLAWRHLESGIFKNAEPGPYRVIAVYSLKI